MVVRFQQVLHALLFLLLLFLLFRYHRRRRHIFREGGPPARVRALFNAALSFHSQIQYFSFHTKRGKWKKLISPHYIYRYHSTNTHTQTHTHTHTQTHRHTQSALIYRSLSFRDSTHNTQHNTHTQNTHNQKSKSNRASSRVQKQTTEEKSFFLCAIDV